MDVAKGVRKIAIDYAVNLLVDKQIECNGTIPSSFYSNVLDSLATHQIVIQRNALQQRVNRERAKRSSAKRSTTPTPNPIAPTAQVVFTQTSTPATASTLTAISYIRGSASAATSNDNAFPTATANDISPSPTSNNGTTRKKGGRPKGTGAVQRKEDNDRYKKCLNEITKAYVAELAINKVLNTSKIGILRKIIAEKKTEFNITKDISENTIQSRAKRHMKDPATHKLESNHPGITSPLAVVELAVLESILQRQKSRQPMTKTEVIKMMNDAIKGTCHEDEFRRVKSERVADALDVDVVGEGWYTNFRKRHKTVLAKHKRRALLLHPC